jgi:alkanesulfonate monooxygenase SsuD/methylene tetrahydromethanopterin reductase-like flavin-dependent oxidoreductase (luciferase family)
LSPAILSTSVLDIPFYNPVILARRLATLGHSIEWTTPRWFRPRLVSGRIRGHRRRSETARADEFLTVRKTIWIEDPVEFHGKYFTVPRSFISAKPVQKPHPPIYLAAYAPAALKRTSVQNR